MKLIISLLTASLLISSILAEPAKNIAPAEENKTENGWQNLFDGKTLKGWQRANGTATFVVNDGVITGTTSQASPNSFLHTDKRFSDFELEFEINIHDKQLNSGVQIRSKHTGGRVEGRVNGPQCEAQHSNIQNGGKSGYIFAEATKYYWLTPKEDRIPHKHFKDGEWNKFKIKAVGPRIQTWINGQPVSDLTHEEFYKEYPSGYIALQVHAVGMAGPFSVSWKNLRIRELNKSN